MKNTSTHTMLYSFFRWMLLVTMVTGHGLGCGQQNAEPAPNATEPSSQKEFFFQSNNHIASFAQPLIKKYVPALGIGVNASETRTFANCVEFKPWVAQKTPFAKSVLSEKMVQSFDEIAKATNISLQTQAKAYWGGFDAGLQNITQVSMKAKNINWLVTARYELEEQMLDTRSESLRLTPTAQALLEDTNHSLQKFFDFCGTHFYAGETRGGTFTALFMVKVYNEQSTNALKAKLSADTWGIVNGKANFETTMRQAKEANCFEFYSDIQGGDAGVRTGLDSGSWSTSKVVEAADALKASIYNNQQGVVIHRTALSYEDIFQLEFERAKKLRMIDHRLHSKDYTDEYRSRALEQFFKRFKYNQSLIEEVGDRLNLLNEDLQGTALETNYMFDLKNMRKTLTLENDEITQYANACVSGDDAACKFKMAVQRVLPERSKGRAYQFLGDWDLMFHFTEEVKNRVYLMELYGENYRFPDTLCKFSSDALFTINNSTDEIEINIPLSGGRFDRLHIGEGPIRITNPENQYLSIPFICMEQFDSVCQLEIKKVTNLSLKLQNERPEHARIRILVFDDFGNVQYKKTLVPTCW